MKRTIVVCLVAVLGVTLVPTIAVGGKKKHETKVSLFNPADRNYEGVVRSKHTACIDDRGVEVWHDTNRNGEVDPPINSGDQDADFEIGFDKTSNDGEYHVSGNQAPRGDQIIAYVTQDRIGKRHVCRAGQKVAVAGPNA